MKNKKLKDTWISASLRNKCEDIVLHKPNIYSFTKSKHRVCTHTAKETDLANIRLFT